MAAKTRRELYPEAGVRQITADMMADMAILVMDRMPGKALELAHACAELNRASYTADSHYLADWLSIATAVDVEIPDVPYVDAFARVDVFVITRDQGFGEGRRHVGVVDYERIR